MSLKTHKVILAILLYLPVMGLSKVTPKLSEERWSEIDVKINQKIGPLHQLLGNNQIPSDVAADQLGQILSEFLLSEPEFEEVEKEYFRNKSSTSLEEARVLKRELKKKAKVKEASHEDKVNWLKAVKLYALLLARSKSREGEAMIRKQEKAYRKNFFKFAKNSCNGTLDQEKVQPRFTKEQADPYFQAKYGQPADVDLKNLAGLFLFLLPPTRTPKQQSDPAK